MLNSHWFRIEEILHPKCFQISMLKNLNVRHIICFMIRVCKLFHYLYISARIPIVDSTNLQFKYTVSFIIFSIFDITNTIKKEQNRIVFE